MPHRANHRTNHEKVKLQYYSTSTLRIRISSSGLSILSVLTFSIVVQTSIPFVTRPNTVCLLSSQGVGTVVMKTINGIIRAIHYNSHRLHQTIELTLRSICIRPCIRHGHGKRSVMSQSTGQESSETIRENSNEQKQVWHLLSNKLVFEFSSPNTFPSRSITQRITGLNHESLNNTMKNNIIIVPGSSMPTKVFQRFGNFGK